MKSSMLQALSFFAFLLTAAACGQAVNPVLLQHAWPAYWMRIQLRHLRILAFITSEKHSLCLPGQRILLFTSQPIIAIDCLRTEGRSRPALHRVIC